MNVSLIKSYATWVIPPGAIAQVIYVDPVLHLTRDKEPYRLWTVHIEGKEYYYHVPLYGPYPHVAVSTYEQAIEAGGLESVEILEHFTNGQTLAGFKGQTFLDTGFVFAPHIPLQVTPLFPIEKKVHPPYIPHEYKIYKDKFYAALTV